MNILFFGSTTDSCIVLSKLPRHSVCAVVTQPPKPIGRTHTVTPTPVEIWAHTNNIPVLSFPTDNEKPWLYQNEDTVISTLEPFKADIVISASYGVKIPAKTISDAKYGGLNVHPSLLPKWRGADPVPWAILSGDHQIGVTIVTLSDSFDTGRIIAQKKIPIRPSDTSDPLRSALFSLGAELLSEILSARDLVLHGTPQQHASGQYARKLTRQDGFEPWENIQRALTLEVEAERIDRKFRAFIPWPGLWSELSYHDKKIRIKILSCHAHPGGSLHIDSVQIEGKNPVSFEQFTRAYLV